MRRLPQHGGPTSGSTKKQLLAVVDHDRDISADQRQIRTIVPIEVFDGDEAGAYAAKVLGPCKCSVAVTQQDGYGVKSRSYFPGGTPAFPSIAGRK
jgi:hypothetical protein